VKRFFLYFIVIAILAIVVVVACSKHVTGVILNQVNITLYVGEIETLIASVHPDNATNKTLNWSSSNSDVATVANNGKVTAVTVTGKEVGVAIITVTTEDGNYMAKCTVQVILFEPEMMFVEGGTFLMGSDYNILEQPIHQVTLSSFNIAKYQITQRVWKSIMGNNPSDTKGDNLPVHKVSWNDVNEFITRLNNVTGKNYRLPTEAEWEYAAGGGKKDLGYTYSGSNNIDKVAWYGMNSNFEPHTVGSKEANELSIYDMSGNVWEWCNDWYGDYPNTPQIDPQGPMSGTRKIIRGGYYGGIDSYCRVKMRMGIESDNTLNRFCGFRLVHS